MWDIKKHQIIEISPENIFENDKLNREPIIENLSLLINNTHKSLILAIDSKWGNGKTTFVKLWKEYLQNKYQVQSIYFNAWEYDYNNEPLILILGEINNFIEENCSTNMEIQNKFEDVKNLGIKVLKKTLPIVVRTATGGVLDLREDIENVLSSLTEETAKTLIDDFSKDKNFINEFKNTINILFKEIGNDKPFVIFIDELDRCKPTFAINLLERVKHLFEIDGLIFIFSIDKTQLIQTIKSQYGNIDGDNYLKKFFDLEYKLPEPDINNFCNYLREEFYEWNKLFKEKNIDYYNLNLDLETIKYLSKSLSLSLREIEKVFFYTDLVYKTLYDNTKSFSIVLIIFLVTIKLKNIVLYEELILKKREHEYFFEKIIYENIKNEYEIKPSVEKVIKLIIHLILLNEENFKKLKKDSESQIDFLSIEEAQDLRGLLENLYLFDYYDLKKFIMSIKHNIEFISNFN